MPKDKAREPMHLTTKIFIGMAVGIIFGMICNSLPTNAFIDDYLLEIITVGGQIFLIIIKMLVVPIVLVSLVCGTCHLKNGAQLGKLAIKTLTLYILTTALAIMVALFFASLFGIGDGAHLTAVTNFSVEAAPSFKEVILDMFPDNPFAALSEGNMLQIIIFAVLIGGAISVSGRSGKYIASFFTHFNEVLMMLIKIIMNLAPYGIFCLIASLFARMGFSLIGHLFSYFITIIFVLAFQWAIVYGAMVRVLANLNPILFFKKMYSAMLFAFSISSSSASIPVVLETCEKKLGVKNSVASFVVPLGATINMDGTAIMQGVATVFIANVYGIHLGFTGYITVVAMATLASIGTAGVPGIGMITLAMVLQQVGLPVEGIGLIIGVDRLLDMIRTAVNVSGDCAVACVVGKSENEFNEKIFNDPNADVV